VASAPDVTDVSRTTTNQAGTVVPSSDDTGANDSNTPVSIWWLIGGVLAAVAAASGIAYGLRRRNDNEEWAREASAACDIGRTTSLTLARVLDTAAVWSRPANYTEQQQRFTDHLTALRSTVPDHDFPDLLAVVSAADDQLRSGVDQIPDGASIATARAAIEPALATLADALSALEQEASIAVFGAALQSSRTTA
jgi:hypothetical protein